MLYYLLDSQLERFVLLYKDAGKYFNKPVKIYEEAILIYDEKYNISVQSHYKISSTTIDRYNDFNNISMQYQGNESMARNVLYWKYGKSYILFKISLPTSIKK